MGKKSFTSNPALQFISEADTEQEAEQTQPVLEAEELQEKPPKGYKLNPVYLEVKSQRLQLVMRPSLVKKVKKAAKKQKLSVNEYVHRVLEEATREEQ